MKKITTLLLCICIFASVCAVTAFAAATDISVASADYYNNGDLKSVNINFGWDSAPATSRLTVMTNRLRSAGETGTDGNYGDFTDCGYYGKAFKTWDAVIEQKGKLGILYYTDERNIVSGKTNSLTLEFEKGDIPLNGDKTYYVYLWTNWGGQHYPDNLFMVLRVKDGQLQYASAKGRNDYGSFSVLKSGTQSTPDSSGSSGNTGNTGNTGTSTPSSTTTSKTGKIANEVAYEKLSLNEFEWEVLRLCNIERAKLGLNSLSMNGTLQNCCDIREVELKTSFSHTRPDGSDCYTVIASGSLSYNVAAENIAMGQRTPKEVVDAWMNSPGHRANILNPEHEYIGVGYNSDGNYWVQLFTDTEYSVISVSTNAPVMELSESEIKNYYLRVKTLLGDLSYMPCDFESMTLDISKYKPLIKTNAIPPAFTKLEESAETPKQEQPKKETEEIDLSAGGIFERYIPIAQVYGASPKVGSMSLEKGGDFYFELLTSFRDESSYAAPDLERKDYIYHHIKLTYIGTVGTIDRRFVKSMRLISDFAIDDFLDGKESEFAKKAHLSLDTVVVSIDLYDKKLNFVRNISPASVILAAQEDGSFITYSNYKPDGAYMYFSHSSDLYEAVDDFSSKNMHFIVDKAMIADKSVAENLLPEDYKIEEYKYTQYPALSGAKQYNTNTILSDEEFITPDGTYYQVATDFQVIDPSVKNEIKNVVSYSYYRYDSGMANYQRNIVTADGTLYGVTDKYEKKTIATNVKKTTANHYLTNNGEVKQIKDSKTIATNCVDIGESNDGWVIGVIKTDGSFHMAYSFVEGGDGYARGFKKMLDKAKGVVSNGVVDSNNTFYRFNNKITAGAVDMNAFASGRVEQEYTLELELVKLCDNATRIFQNKLLTKVLPIHDSDGISDQIRTHNIYGFVQSSDGKLYGFSSKYSQYLGTYGEIENFFSTYEAANQLEGTFVGFKVKNEPTPYAIAARYCDNNEYRWGKMSIDNVDCPAYVCATQGGYYAVDGRVYGTDPYFPHPGNSGRISSSYNVITNFPNMHRDSATYSAYNRTIQKKIELLPSVYTWYNDNSRITLLERTDGSMWMAGNISPSSADLLICTKGYESSNVIRVSNPTTAKGIPDYVEVKSMSFPGNTQASKLQFIDVTANAWYTQAVNWAVEKGITTGTTPTTFSPDNTCTRAQILTFLWRAVGSPKMSGSNPFSDVKSSDYFYDAALWASNKGMVSGTTFAPNTPCTRSATVVYLWKNAGSPSASYKGNFTDVQGSSEYAKAVAWAVEKGVTTGTTPTTFSPDTTCTRGQIVTFLQRALEK